MWIDVTGEYGAILTFKAYAFKSVQKCFHIYCSASNSKIWFIDIPLHGIYGSCLGSFNTINQAKLYSHSQYHKILKRPQPSKSYPQISFQQLASTDTPQKFNNVVQLKLGEL